VLSPKKSHATEINSLPPRGYSWSIALHKGGSAGADGVGLDENLTFDVDEGWTVTDWYLDNDSDFNYVTVQSDGQSNKIYFSCQPINF